MSIHLVVRPSPPRFAKSITSSSPRTPRPSGRGASREIAPGTAPSTPTSDDDDDDEDDDDDDDGGDRFAPSRDLFPDCNDVLSHRSFCGNTTPRRRGGCGGCIDRSCDGDGTRCGDGGDVTVASRGRLEPRMDECGGDVAPVGLIDGGGVSVDRNDDGAVVVVNDAEMRKDGDDDDESPPSRDDRTCDEMKYRISACLEGVVDVVRKEGRDVPHWARWVLEPMLNGELFDYAKSTPLPRRSRRLGRDRRSCDMRCCGGIFSIDVASTTPSSSTDVYANIAENATGTADVAENATGTRVVFSCYDGGDDGDDDDDDDDYSTTDSDNVRMLSLDNANLSKSSTYRRGLHNYRVAASLVDDSTACSMLEDVSRASSSDDVFMMSSRSSVPRIDAYRRNDTVPSFKNVAENPTIAIVRHGDVTGRLGIAPMINDIYNVIVRHDYFSSGGHYQLEENGRRSNIDDHDSSQRHHKTLSLILTESNSVYFSSMFATTDMEDMTTKVKATPLPHADGAVANATAQSTTTTATFGWNRAKLTKAKMRRRKLRALRDDIGRRK